MQVIWGVTVERLTAAGGRGDQVEMLDPEGNEFCGVRKVR